MQKMNYWGSEVGPARGRLSVRRAFQRMDRSATDRGQDDLPLRHRHASRRGRAPGRARQRGVCHHGLEGGVRFLRRARRREFTRGKIISGLFRGHLSQQSEAPAGFRRRDDVSPLRVLAPQHHQRRVRRSGRPRAPRHDDREDAPGRAYSAVHATRTAGARRGNILPVWEKEQPVERVDDFKTLLVYRKKN